MFRYLFFLFFLFFFIANGEVISEYTSNKIRTVILHKIENKLLDPIIQLNSNDKIQLSFDELGADMNNYTYSFIHCDYEWKKSDLLPSEYIEGFMENYIDNFSFSFNTNIDYVNYKCQFPNESINFLISGNYILIVKNEADGEIVIKRKFVVYEKIAQVKAIVKRATFVNNIDSKQEIDFEIFYSNLNVLNPIDEIKVVVQKNDNWNNTKSNIKPSFIGKDYLEYDYDDEINFDGGNEFRDFDISSLRFFSKNIDTIYTKKNNYNNSHTFFVKLKKEKKKTNNTYVEKYDLNGKLLIQKDNSNFSESESEYVLVKFSLEKTGLDLNQQIFLFGALSNWSIDSDFLLNYNTKSKNFEKEVLLKQGYYNYQYVTINEDGELSEIIEGNHYETNNEYTIYVYHKSPWERYDRIIAVEKITSNSLN